MVKRSSHRKSSNYSAPLILPANLRENCIQDVFNYVSHFNLIILYKFSLDKLKIKNKIVNITFLICAAAFFSRIVLRAPI